MSDLQEQLDVFGPDYDPKHKNHVYWAAKKYALLVEKQPTCDHTCLFHYRAVTPLSLSITPEDTDDIIGVDGEPKWMPGDPDDGPILR